MARQRSDRPGARRFVEWIDFDLRMATAALAATQTFGSITSVGAEFTVRQTLTRLRGQAFFSWTPNAADDVMIVGLGIIVVNSDAFGQSALAVPSPTDDLAASFVWHQLMTFGPAFSATETAADLQLFYRLEIDSKAQRKVGPNEILCLIADGVQVVGTPTCDLVASVRMLSMLT